jgi:hypothetical protein
MVCKVSCIALGALARENICMVMNLTVFDESDRWYITIPTGLQKRSWAAAICVAFWGFWTDNRYRFDWCDSLEFALKSTKFVVWVQTKDF